MKVAVNFGLRADGRVGAAVQGDGLGSIWAVWEELCSAEEIPGGSGLPAGILLCCSLLQAGTPSQTEAGSQESDGAE